MKFKPDFDLHHMLGTPKVGASRHCHINNCLETPLDRNHHTNLSLTMNRLRPDNLETGVTLSASFVIFPLVKMRPPHQHENRTITSPGWLSSVPDIRNLTSHPSTCAHKYRTFPLPSSRLTLNHPTSRFPLVDVAQSERARHTCPKVASLNMLLHKRVVGYCHPCDSAIDTAARTVVDGHYVTQPIFRDLK